MEVQIQLLKIRISLGGSALFAVSEFGFLGLGAKKSVLSMRDKTLKKSKVKTVALSLVIAASMSLPLDASAQSGMFQQCAYESDQGLLGRGPRSSADGNFSHQTFGSNHAGIFTHQTFGSNPEGNFTHQTFGNAPLGGGWFILISAGVGYATLKRKKQIKNSVKQNKSN